ncbi:MAG: S8 family serine peptidase [Xanthobacteraceae bacterium]|jgi:subtilisin family serine protease
MQLRGHDTSNLRAGVAIVLLILGAVAIGVGSVSDAVAIDQPKHLAKAAKKKQLSKAKGVEPGQNSSATTPAALGKNVLGKGAPGKGVLGKDALNKHTLSKDALSKNVLSKGTLGKNALSKNALTKDGLGKNVLGKRATTMVERQRFRLDHRRELLTARLRLPHRPLPGERGFTGVPPAGETRFVSTEMVFQVGSNVSRQALDTAMRRLGLSTIASQTVGLTGGTLFHLRVADGRAVAEVVRALEAENIGIAQPNYVYQLRQDATLAARGNTGDSGQYVVSKLRLGEAHRVATGSNVLVAVIDSAIDVRHPDLAGAVVEQFSAVGRPEKPHVHGTGMVGAIAAHSRLLGIAPKARILAVHAFSADSRQSPEATTRHIIAGLEWAIGKGARVINMSFAGPYDPMLQLAMKNAHAKGVVLIAAAGNAGAKSPPLYPAADPHVIAVTATDQNDQLFGQAVQGPHVAVAAPGVDIAVPAPSDAYQITTGTSVAAAHVSGVAALLIERHPSVDAATVLEVLTSSAKRLAAKGRDDQFGWGLVDPASALAELDARITDGKVATPAKPSAPKPSAPKPGAVSSR